MPLTAAGELADLAPSPWYDTMKNSAPNRVKIGR